MDSYANIMEEIIKEVEPVMKDLFDEHIKPLVEYRKKLEKEIGTKEIEDMYRIEQGEV